MKIYICIRVLIRTFLRKDLERCLSGRKERFAKSSYLEIGTQGSNPCLSARVCVRWQISYKQGSLLPVVSLFSTKVEIHSLSGCSVARLSRRVWDAEVAGSNPATPTNLEIGKTKTLLIV